MHASTQLQTLEIPRWPIAYSQEVETALKQIEAAIEPQLSETPLTPRFLSHKLLEGDPIYSVVYDIQPLLNQYQESDLDSQLVHEQYQWIERIVQMNRRQTAEQTPLWQDRLDDVLTNKWLGLPLFAFMMYFVFLLTFNVGGIFLDAIDQFFSVQVATLGNTVLDPA